ncbi:MAG TPA: STN domain-containing protein, partial [Mucilaginibacter sp.]
MKFTVLMILIGCLQLNAKSYSQTITLKAKNASIEKVFTAIEKQSGYYFFYRANEIKEARPVTLSLENATLEQALRECFKNEPFSYTIDKKTIIVNKKAEAIIAADKITV